ADDAGRGGPRLAAPRHRDAGFPDDHRDAVHVLHRQRHHARDRLVRARPGPHRARPRRPPPPLRPRRRAPPLLRDHRLLTMPTDRLTDLKNRLALVQDLRASAAVLEWDQETYMPPGAAEARAHQLATLKTLAHRRFTDEAVGALLDGLDGLVEDEFDRALVRVTRRDFERATKLSAELVARLPRAQARALEASKRRTSGRSWTSASSRQRPSATSAAATTRSSTSTSRRRRGPRWTPPSATSAPSSSRSSRPSPRPTRRTTRSSTGPTTRSASGTSASTCSAPSGTTSRAAARTARRTRSRRRSRWTTSA